LSTLFFTEALTAPALFFTEALTAPALFFTEALTAPVFFPGAVDFSAIFVSFPSENLLLIVLYKKSHVS
jgi:hypothetical protein